jgi:hypothetical protein
MMHKSKKVGLLTARKRARPNKGFRFFFSLVGKGAHWLGETGRFFFVRTFRSNRGWSTFAFAFVAAFAIFIITNYKTYINFFFPLPTQIEDLSALPNPKIQIAIQKILDNLRKNNQNSLILKNVINDYLSHNDPFSQFTYRITGLRSLQISYELEKALAVFIGQDKKPWPVSKMGRVLSPESEDPQNLPKLYFPDQKIIQTSKNQKENSKILMLNTQWHLTNLIALIDATKNLSQFQFKNVSFTKETGYLAELTPDNQTRVKVVFGTGDFTQKLNQLSVITNQNPINTLTEINLSDLNKSFLKFTAASSENHQPL